MLKIMGPSLTLGRIAGIPVKLHWSFSLLLLLAAYIVTREELPLTAALWFFAFIGFLFLFVVMHEFGHALMARRYGVVTRDVILSPIGGVARLEQIPANPWQELWIALAGPAVNVVLFIIIGILLWVSGGTIIPEAEDIYFIANWKDLCGFLLIMNLMLVIFNMIPAFPMDGGRVLRALLTMGLGDRLKATKVASYIGQFLAFLFISFGLYYQHYGGVFIGLFVMITARAEYRQLKMMDLLNKTLVRDVMRKEYSIFREDESLKEPYSKRKEGSFLIQDLYGNIVGVLPNIFLRRVKKEDLNQPIRSNMMTEWGHIHEQMTLQVAFNALNERGWALAPVLDANNVVVGVIDRTLIRKILK